MSQENPSSRELLEIPKDWVLCLIVGDVEFLNDLKITQGKTQYFGGPFGEARCIKAELTDPAAFEAEVQRISSGTSQVFFNPYFLTQKEMDEDHAKQPQVDAALEKKKQTLLDGIKKLKLNDKEV